MSFSVETMSTAIDQRSGKWYALDVSVERAAGEAVEYALMEAGSLGTEANTAADELVMVTAYFPAEPDRELIQEELSEALRIYNLPSSSVRDMHFREVPDCDWLSEWKKGWQPVELGRLVIAPPWSEVSINRDQVVVRIEPGMAFGTGTHETTRLCLKAIMRFFKGGSFLDVGTGTGILAIAAAKLFPEARIEACDTDAEAVAIARENARLNGVGDRIVFWVGSLNKLAENSGAEVMTASADFVCANLTADVIGTIMPALIAATCGRLVLSGILDAQIDAVVDQLQQSGNSGNLVMMQDGEWLALVV